MTPPPPNAQIGTTCEAGTRGPLTSAATIGNRQAICGDGGSIPPIPTASWPNAQNFVDPAGQSYNNPATACNIPILGKKCPLSRLSGHCPDHFGFVTARPEELSPERKSYCGRVNKKEKEKSNSESKNKEHASASEQEKQLRSFFPVVVAGCIKLFFFIAFVVNCFHFFLLFLSF